MLIYIVRRESAEGPENDCFEDLELATQWAEFINSEVEEENTIDIQTMKSMMNDEENPQ